VVAQMIERSRVEKWSARQVLSPIEWRRAFEEVIPNGKRKRQMMRSRLLAVMATITFVATLLVAAFKLFDLMPS